MLFGNALAIKPTIRKSIIEKEINTPFIICFIFKQDLFQTQTRSLFIMSQKLQILQLFCKIHDLAILLDVCIQNDSVRYFYITL